VYENNYLLEYTEAPEAHYENVLDQGGYGEVEGKTVETKGCKLVLRHNTFLNEHPQTANIALFCEEPSGKKHPIGEVVIENNLLVGGGHALYGGATTGSGGSHCKPASQGVNVEGPFTVKGNRLARCLTPPIEGKGHTQGGQELGSGTKICEGGADSHGYYPNSGAFPTIWEAIESSVTIISGNYWDDSLAEVE
jgi:hypothetical protein